MKMIDTMLCSGGFFRCCYSIGENLEEEVQVGDETHCVHCNEKFILQEEGYLDYPNPVWVPEWQLKNSAINLLFNSRKKNDS